MKVLIIPSWFPSQSNPYAGIFCVEQAKAMAQCYPNDEFYILNYGQDELLIDLKSPKQFLSKFKLKRKYKKGMNEISANLFQINMPVLTWNYRIGGFEYLVNRLIKDLKGVGFSIDLCHAHVAYPAGAIALKLKEHFGIPYVVTEHMAPFPFKHHLKNGKVEKKLMNAYSNAVSVIGVSPSMLKNMNAVHIPNVKYIPNVIDEEMFQIKKVNKKGNRIFSLGGLVERKGFQFLIKALSKVKEDFNCRIGGEGPFKRELEDMIEFYNLRDRISLLGSLTREQVLDEFQKADFFVLPSLYESFGVVYVEAMMTGLPVIATKCGGPENFVSEKSGVLCEPRDVNCLMETITSFLRSERHFNAEEIRESALEKFSKKVVCHEIYQEYLKCVV